MDHITRSDAASDFNGIEHVPKKAITMGISTILKAKRIILLAWGHKKAPMIKDTIEGTVSSSVPATFLQNHQNITLILDDEAASELTRIKTPWLVGQCIWTEKLRLKAVTWLSELLNKPILKLTDKDYNEHGMSGLLAIEGSSYDLNIKIFDHLQHTITGWPGGKPNADDTHRPERALPEKKRVLIFSPHPDDDVISMGGTLLRLIDQGHDVHVVYQTSGNIAVTDQEALKFAEVFNAFTNGPNSSKFQETISYLKSKKTSDRDPDAILKIKGLIRRMESLGAIRHLGLSDDNVHFLDLPFYETGRVKKKPLSREDITLTKKRLLKKLHRINCTLREI
ncbi:glucosamine-6-phosphate deaminase [Aquimarina intermedia]|uniref:Glucosamine-6-phosphate deaminase n=1 Tax=Aquimarina intermedia TaxID=350814 RepID=A0A5S5CB29_9FLAO|nr:glucosamine-6-phosphate deaminase [Aquimarina intermedia]